MILVPKGLQLIADCTECTKYTNLIRASLVLLIRKDYEWNFTYCESDDALESRVVLNYTLEKTPWDTINILTNERVFNIYPWIVNIAQTAIYYQTMNSRCWL